MGLISLYNPCVFPMIPMTVGAFTPGEGETNRNYTLEAFVYFFSIIFTFSIVGVFFSIIFGATGITKLATNPILNLVIGFIFLYFAYSLLGPQTMDPVFITNFKTYLGKKSKGGYLGFFLRGVIISITTFTCTMPFVGSILVTATSDNWIVPLLGMVSYGFAFALPFGLIAQFPKISGYLPKGGNWFEKFKGSIGILEIIASLKFFSNADLVMNTGILKRNIFLFLTIILLFILILYILNFIHSPSEYIKLNNRTPAQYSISFLILLLILYLGSGMYGNKLSELEAYLPPATSSHIWMSDLETAKLNSKQNQKPILINFTGYSCANCRWMESNILNQPELKDLFENFILLELYTDGDDPKEEKNQEYLVEKFKTIGIPFYAIIDEDEKIISTREGITRQKNDFTNFLNNSLITYNKNQKL